MMQEIKLIVEGMHCKSCKMLVEDALQELGAAEVQIQVDEKKQLGAVACKYSGSVMDVVNAIKKEGYKVRK